MAKRQVLLATGLVAIVLFGTGFSGPQWTSYGPINAPPGAGAGEFGRTSIHVDPTATGPTYTVFAAASTNDPAGTGGLFKSLDSGFSWTRTYTQPLGCLAVDPGDPNRLFACPVTLSPIRISTDGGTNFTSVSDLGNRQYTSIAIKTGTTGSSAIVYASGSACGAGDTQCKIFRSTNGGSSWTSLGVSGVGQLPSAGANLVRIDPVATTDNLYVVISGELWRSTDSGANWSQLTVPGTVIGADVYRAPSDSFATVFALSTAGVYMSTNGGGSFADFQTASLPSSAQSTGSRVVLLPGCPNVYLAVNSTTAAGGVYRSISGGAWQAFSTGLTETRVRGLTVGPGNSGPAYRLYAATSEGHVWGREVGCIVP